MPAIAASGGGMRAYTQLPQLTNRRQSVLLQLGCESAFITARIGRLNYHSFSRNKKMEKLSAKKSAKKKKKVRGRNPFRTETKINK